MMSTRSRAAVTLGAIALVSLAAGCSGDTASSASEATLAFVAYGGDGQKAMIKDWQEPYTKANPGVKFVNTSPPDIAQVKAQVQNNVVQWDVVAVAPAAAQQNCGTLFEPLTFTGLDTSTLVKGAVGKCYIANFINATPFAYRTDAFPDPAKAPKTIADFFDVAKFPGQRGMLTNVQNGLLEYALLADGVAPDAMYPLDVDRALAKLATIRKKTTFAPNVGALQQAVGSKQVDLFMLPDSRLVPLMNQGTDITVVWDKTVTSINAFAVPKGSKKLAAAEGFMKSVVSPEAVAAISEDLGTAPVNRAAKPNLSANAKKVEVYGPVNTGKTVLQDIDWYAANYNAVNDKLTNWLAG